MSLPSFTPSGVLAFVCLACSATSSPSSPGGATAAQVDTCKHSGCDKMKFFGCASAEDQAACYADCDQASTGQIDLFTSCATNSVCDPACRTNIVPKPSASGGAPPSGAGASAPSCGDACDKLVSCSFIRLGQKDGCVAACEKSAYQYQIDCVNSNTCDKLKSACGDPTGSTSTNGSAEGEAGGGSGSTSDGGACQSACDTLTFFQCADAATHQSCRDTCATAPANTRDAFTSCVGASGSNCTAGMDCYGQLTR